MCVQRAGDVVYVPQGWWHATYNIPYDGAVDDVAIGVGGLGPSPGLHFQVSEGDIWALEEALAEDPTAFNVKTGR